MSEKTVFQKIADGEIPADLVHEDEHCIAFHDIEHSPDHTLIAYAVDEQGSEYYTIRFKNLETGRRTV